MLNLDQAETFNCLAWILKHHIKNENGSPIEFGDHTFMIEPYMDCTPRQAIIKCSQIGWSVLAIIRSFHLAKFAKANIIHTFPSRNMSKDFVIPKVNPIIEKNPDIQKFIGKDSVFLKQIGDRYIYYRGTYEQTEAISISANILINDEYDRSNPKVLRTYRSRLDDSARERPELGWEWKFSNPSIPGFGVDVDWQRSDMKHWFVKCRYCGHEGYMRWPESINFERKTKVCYKCGTDLSKDDLRNGRWVKKYLNREISGYWLSQLFVPWIPASKIIEDSKGDQSVFYNFTLGLPYVSKDTTVTRQAILDCISPGYNSRTNVAIGVDNGVIKHYVIGNRQGIFAYGKTDNWQEIEDLRNRYNATMVIDAMPYPNTPNKLAEKYPGKVFVHFYRRDASSGDLIKWSHDSHTVQSDRTKIIDFIVGEINSKDITFNLTITDLEEYLNHWKSMYRIVQDTPLGVKKPSWQHIDGQPDHYAHATVYWRIAIEQTLNNGGISTSHINSGRIIDRNPVVSEDLTVPALDLDAIAQRAARRTKRR